MTKDGIPLHWSKRSIKRVDVINAWKVHDISLYDPQLPYVTHWVRKMFCSLHQVHVILLKFFSTILFLSEFSCIQCFSGLTSVKKVCMLIWWSLVSMFFSLQFFFCLSVCVFQGLDVSTVYGITSIIKYYTTSSSHRCLNGMYCMFLFSSPPSSVIILFLAIIRFR